MKNTVKKIINFRFDRYEEIERKLEVFAAKGLFLEECDSFLWTFRKGTPKKLKYTVTYFSEGSVFNPDITDNQQTYFEYAEAAGWNFVTQWNQMQIFYSEADNPIPFETDEREKLKNIKKCMKKSFLPSTIILTVISILNLLIRFHSLQRDPIDFLSDSTQLILPFMLLTVCLYEIYSLLDYFLWCKHSEKSINSGGICIKNSSMVHKIIDTLFLIFILIGCGYYLLCLALKISWLGLLLSIGQMPIMMFVFWSSIKYLKRKKATAVMNKVISITVLMIANFSYLAFIVILVLKSGLTLDNNSAYRTVTWSLNEEYSREYRLYKEDIPLTCEDLYGSIDYDYYSYEKENNHTFLLTKSSYRQTSLPAKDAPPRIEYEILEPEFDFIYQIAKNHLLKIPEWQISTSFQSIDNKIFNTAEAYQQYFQDTPTGKYILFFSDKMIVLNMEEPLTSKQILTIREKLNFLTL